MSEVNLALAMNLPPERAVEYFQAKGQRITAGWRDMVPAAHAGAVTVAGVLKGEVLQDIVGALGDALAKGEPYGEFLKKLRPRLKSKGWWGIPHDPNTGEVLQGRAMTPHRLRTVYQTNLQSAYMAGRYKAQLENADQRPYFKYVAILDSRTRPRHRALHGRIFRYDDTLWGVVYPPNGYNCRCRVVALSQEEFDAEGGLLSNGGDFLEAREIPVGNSGETVWVTGYKDPQTKEWFAPDPGFDSNPGAGVWGRDIALARRVQGIASPEIRRQVWQALNGSAERQADYMTWIRAQHSHESPRKSVQTLGFISDEVAEFWAAHDDDGRLVRVVGMQGSGFKHADSAKHFAGGYALSVDQYAMLPGLIAAPEAVFYDTKWQSLVFTRTLTEERAAFVVVKPGSPYPIAGEGHKRATIDGVANAYIVPSKWLDNGKRFKRMGEEKR